MNKRIREILKLIIKNPEMKLSTLTSELDLTRRQINYAINQFNEELKTKNIPLIQRSHSGNITVPIEVIQMISQPDYDIGDDQELVVLTDSERQALIVMTLIANIDYISLDHLVDAVDVSKTTVMEDIKRTEPFIRNYSLTIRYNRMNGYQLVGSEHRILQLLSDLVKRYPIFRREMIRRKLAQDVSEEEIVHLIHNMEQMLHLSYSDESVDYLQTSARFLVSRGIKMSDKHAFFPDDVTDTPEFRMLMILVHETGWSLSKSYMEWFTLLFLTSNIFESKTTQNYDSDQELRKLISQMVENFQNQTLILIDDREDFERRILSHLRPACFRIRYNLSLGVYSIDSLIKDSNHAILIDLMKELIIPIENWLNKAFPNDELDLLSYYFGYQLSNHNKLNKQRQRAVVVCTNGIMVSKLVRANMEKLFPEIHFLASLSVRDFYKFEADYDLVFTTTPLKSSMLQFMIEPIMTYQQQISLRYRVLSDLGITKVDRAMDELLTIIRKYANITNPVSLREELQYFLIKEDGSTPLDNFKVLPSLTYYLRPSYVQIVEEEMSWERAVEVACRPLLEHQIIDSRFIADCLDQIRQPGYAGYLGMKTCIPHTTVDKGVISDGVSILVCKKPIRFPNGEDVSLILPLSFFDLTKHLRAINQIADIAKDDSLIEQLLIADDEKTVYQLLRQRS